MCPYLYDVSPRAQELDRNAGKHPDHLFMYLSTLEAENARLADSTEHLTARNIELNDIIERASKDYIHGRNKKERHFTETLLKRIAQLDTENRNLRSSQYFNALLRQQSRVLQDEQKCQTGLSIGQAENIDQEYNRLSESSNEYGIDGARLRSELDILKHNLDVPRRSGEIRYSVLVLESEAELGESKEAKGRLGAGFKPEILSGQNVEETVPSQEKLQESSHGRFTETIKRILDSEAKGSQSENQRMDIVQEQFLPLSSPEAGIFISHSENEQLRAGLNATQQISTELAHIKAQNRHLHSELAVISSQFSQASSNAKETFGLLFEKAISTVWSNFGKLQLTMDEQIQDSVDKETAVRVAKFSRRVREFGQRPLLKLQEEVKVLVDETYDHFRHIQQSLHTMSTRNSDFQEPTKCQRFEGHGGIEDEAHVKEGEHHNSTYLQCLRTGDHRLHGIVNSEIQVEDQGANTEHHNSTYLQCIRSEDSSSLEYDANCGGSDDETEIHDTLFSDPKNTHDADGMYNEAAQADLAWMERALPKRREASTVSVKELRFPE